MSINYRIKTIVPFILAFSVFGCASVAEYWDFSGPIPTAPESPIIEEPAPVLAETSSPDEDALRLWEAERQEAARRQAAEDEERRQIAEQDAARRQVEAQEAARRQAEAQEAARRRIEVREAARKQAEEEAAQRQAEETARKQAEEAEASRQWAEAEARKRADEAAALRRSQADARQRAETEEIGQPQAEKTAQQEPVKKEVPLLGERASAFSKNRLPRYYRVVWGDTLWSIAANPLIYNNSSLWTRLYEANQDMFTDPNNPRLIIPGMIFEIPSLDAENREGLLDPRR
jgi:nucleoid-associated protein YgaU